MERKKKKLTRNLLVLPRDPVHERRQLEVVRLADRLGSHLDVQRAAVLLADDVADRLDRLLEPVDRALLVRRVAHHDVQGRSDESNLDRHLVRRERLARRERVLDRENPVVAKVGHLEVGADLDRLRRESSRNVVSELFVNVGGDVEFAKDGFRLAFFFYRTGTTRLVPLPPNFCEFERTRLTRLTT